MNAPRASTTSKASASTREPHGAQRWAALRLHQRALLAMVVVMVAALAFVLQHGALAPFLDRPIHRLLHIVGAIFFLGNVAVGALWLGFADASGSRAVLRFATRMVNIADLVFTGPAALLLFVNGAALASAWGGLGAQPWLARSVFLFGVLALLWALVLVPLQIQIENRIEAEGDVPAPLSAPLRKRLIAYFIVGGAAGVLALASLIIMVLR